MQVQQYYAKAIKKGRADGKGGLSNKTVHYHHRVLRQALSHAVDMQMITRNPADTAKPPKPKKFSAMFLDEKTSAHYLTAAQNARMEIPVLLAIALGLRRAEVLGLRWKDIDFDRRSITISQTLINTRRADIQTPKKRRVNQDS